ncbi:unnamed protein product, partial [Urochloa humidicola]
SSSSRPAPLLPPAHCRHELIPSSAVPGITQKDEEEEPRAAATSPPPPPTAGFIHIKMSSSSSPCAACKLLRRKCTQGCVFAPYFPPDNPAKFANVHRVFGASNVSKLLNELPQAQREDAVNSLAYEAEARLRDPVYGCVSYISVLQLRIKQARDELAAARKELAGYIGPAAFAPFVAAAAPP